MEKDWNSEVDALTEGTEFLKMEAGTHKVKFLNEGEAKVIEWDGKQIDKVFFNVEKEGEQYTWSVTKARTYSSLYGQIALFAKHNNGLTDKTLTVVVKGSGKQKDYTIMESLDLQQKEKPTEEKVE